MEEPTSGPRARSPRDFSSLRPDPRAHPWRSVRRRQRRMHQPNYLGTPPYSSRFNVMVTTDAIYMVSSYPVPLPAPNRPRTTDQCTQTEPLQSPPRISTGTQTRQPSVRADIAVQTCSPSKANAAIQTSEAHEEVSVMSDTEDLSPPTVQDQDELYHANPVPSDDMWRSSPQQYQWDYPDVQSLLDPPLPPIPPFPRPPREYVKFQISEEWGHQINIQKPPAPPPPRASYSLAATTADVMSFVSQHYPSILHAQYDYYRLPPFQRRAILDLHRLLFPYGLSKWR